MKGRPRLSASHPKLVARIIDLYKRTGNMRHVATELSISSWTVSKYVRLAGLAVPIKKNLIAGVRRHRSKLAEWIRENPNVKLPNTTKEIAKLTGLSIDTVRSYLGRRKMQAEAMKQDLPDLKEIPLLLLGDDGIHFATRTLKTCIVECDYRNYDYIVTGETWDGKRVSAHIKAKTLRNKLEMEGIM